MATATLTRPIEPAAAEAGAELVVQVEESSGPCYAYEARDGRVRLIGVASPPRRQPAEVGHLERSLGPDGKPLPALLLAAQPLSPGVDVPVRLLGAVCRADTGEPFQLVAVPLADPAFHGLASVHDLPPGRRQELLRFLLTSGSRSFVGAGVAWAGPEAAAAAARQALQARRRLDHARRAAATHTSTWRVSSLALRRWAATEAERHTEAEYAILLLPYRFQQRAREALLPDERILAAVHRPAFGTGGPWSLLRRRQLDEALLLLTDQQVVLLTDVRAPDGSLVDWGYLARATAPERVARVEVGEGDGLAWLEVLVDAAAGSERLRFPFPPEALPDLHALADRLAAFQPVAGERRLRRRPRFPAVDAAALPEQAGLDLSQLPTLERALAAASPGRLLVSAFAPPLPEERLPARLLAVTDEALWLVGPGAAPRRIPIAAISSVELKHALAECWLRISLPHGLTVEALQVRFPYPAADHFVEAHLALRRLLNRPTTAGNAEVRP